MNNLKPIPFAIKRINRGSGCGNSINTAPFEIHVPNRSTEVASSRGQRADQLMKIEWDFGQRILQQLWHVTFARPPFDVAVHVIQKRIQPATGNDDPNPLVENGGIDR